MPILFCATVVYRFDRKRRPLVDDVKNKKSKRKAFNSSSQMVSSLAMCLVNKRQRRKYREYESHFFSI